MTKFTASLDVREINTENMQRFDTCFFERYAKITLTHLLGKEFDSLINRDRPDLQSPDGRLGIEVTRAMEESRNAENLLIKEMAGVRSCADDCDEVQAIIDSGYGYGLQDGRFIGSREYDYWALALPLKRILENKISKVADGFYGSFDSMGLYVFCKDDLSDDTVSRTCSFVTEKQSQKERRYDTLYLSEISNLYVCDLSGICPSGKCAVIHRHPIPKELRRQFFMEALDWGEAAV